MIQEANRGLLTMHCYSLANELLFKILFFFSPDLFVAYPNPHTAHLFLLTLSSRSYGEGPLSSRCIIMFESADKNSTNRAKMGVCDA